MISERSDSAVEQLSRRELQIARAYAQGDSYKEVAQKLGIAPATVRTHLGTIYRKLEVGSKVALIRVLSGVSDSSDDAVAPKHAEPDSREKPLLPQLTRELIGRSLAISELEKLIWRDGTALVTVTGPGGSGKTTLGLEVARRARSDGHSVGFVELAAIRDPKLVVSHVLQALDLRVQNDIPHLQALIQHLRKEPTFLVLDNFEQILPAADEIALILASCPRLKLLVTSREPLHVRGEQEYPLPPLLLPGKEAGLEEIEDSPAVLLFCDRARAVRPSFDLTKDNAAAIVGICARLDGLPLALELAAARVRLMEPAELLARLDKSLPLLVSGARDLPARQQTLQSTIQWSYDLLEPKEKQLLMSLAIFFGGCELEAIQAVCLGSQTDLYEGLDMIESLVAKSLLVHMEKPGGHARFRLLETVREFGLERLQAEQTYQDLAKAHAAYYASFVEAADVELRGSDQLVWLDRLDADHGNLRAALTWCIETVGQRSIGMRIAAGLGWFWRMRGHVGEAIARAEEILALCPEQTLVRATALWRLTLMTSNQDRTATKSMTYAEEAVSIGRALNDIPTIAWALHALGRVQGTIDDHQAARASFGESLALFEDLGDLVGMAYSGWMLGSTERDLYNFDAARRYLEKALRDAEQSGEIWAIASTTQQLGTLELRQANYSKATAYFKESLAQYRLMDARWGMWFPIVRLLIAAAAQRHFVRAAVLSGVEAALRQETGSGESVSESRYLTEAREAIHENLTAPVFKEKFKLGHSLWYREAVEYALSNSDEG